LTVAARWSGRGDKGLVEITYQRFLSGPNRYALRSVLLVRTRFGDMLAGLLEAASSDIAGFADIGGFAGGLEIANLTRHALKSLKPGATGIKLMIEIAGCLQDRYVIQLGRGEVIGANLQDVTVLLMAEDEQVGLSAWELACDIVLAMQGDAGLSAQKATAIIERHRLFVLLARRRSLNQLTIAIARAAMKLDIPVYRTEPTRQIIQLGQGHLRRFAFETMVEPISHFGVMDSRDKWSTLACMRRLGIPTLPSAVAASEEAAVAIAEKIGHAVVVKPVDGGKGRGVSIDLKSADQVRHAYGLAAPGGGRVLVERFATGGDYRLLVVGGQMIAAANRIPAQIRGDGRRSVAELIAALNADPRRGTPYEKLLEKVNVDHRVKDLLARQSMSLATVPADGLMVMLSLAGNISQGGTAVDVTAIVHADNREVAERAAAALGLNVAGIDFITPDISKSWREIGGWILEVNTPPGLRPHWIANPAQDVVTPIVRQVFPAGSPARIPTAGVTGSIGKTTTCQMVACIAQAAGMTPGLTTTQGIWSGKYRVTSGDASGGRLAKNLLTDPMIDIGVFEFARGGLLKYGMSIDGVDVAAVLNVHDNHVGLDGISTREELAAVKSILVRNARRWVFLNAEDQLALGMRQLVKNARLALVSLDPANLAVVSHHNDGHCAVTLNGAGDAAGIRLTDGGKVVLDLPLLHLPAARAGKARSVVGNALFAVGIAYGLGLSAKDIQKGLSGFTSDAAQNPGRHNRIDGLPFEVIVHWADGVPALADMMATLDQEPSTGTRHLYLTTPGNRGDEWIRALGRTTAGHFDRYYCADMGDLRGRKPGEVSGLLAQGLRDGGVAEAAIIQCGEQDRSVLMALNEARGGDRIAFVTYETEAALGTIERYRRSRAQGVDDSGGSPP
jgi:cyanophycin synthetase